MQIEEIQSPTPTIESREINIETRNNKIEPANGTLKQVMTMSVITQVKTIAIVRGGTVFPSNISNEDKGLTMSWSNVPISLSRAIESAVKRSVRTSASIAIKTVKIYHLYSRLGLYQFLITGVI